MFTLLLGTDWKANREWILKAIRSDVKANKENVILMVPESISHHMERRLCDMVGDNASLHAEVLSFPRLASRVGDQLGIGAFSCMDNGGRVVAMASAAIQLHSKLKSYAALETRPEFLTGLVDAIDEFKRCCISADDLLQASKNSEGSLAQKLEELALILDAYDGVCQQGKRDPRDLMFWLMEQLEACDYAYSKTFYVEGFPDFTRQHLEILKHFIQYAENVVISLNCDVPGSTAPAFETAGNTAMQLLRFATDNNIPVKIETLDAGNNVLHNVSGKLFQGNVNYMPELSQRLHLYRCDGIAHECDETAEQILKLVRNGARYRDISVVCTDIAAYRGALTLAFARRNIPIYISGTEDILDMPVINTTLAALDAALCGFEQQDMLRYLKSALSPIEPAVCDELENYIVQWNIAGNRWNESWQYHPDGLNKKFDAEVYERIAKLEEARILIIEPLSALRNAFKVAKSVDEQTVALYQFLSQIRMPQRLERLATHMDNTGENRNAQILGQLWEILVGALEQLHDVLGHSAWDPMAFTRLLHLLLSQYDVGTIPPVLDAVTAGPISAMSCQQERHLFVIGAQEGMLPGYSGATGILNDQERIALRKLGVPLTGGAMDGLQAEFAQIYSVFCGAEETITVMCPSEQKSFIYSRIEKLIGEDQKLQPSEFAFSNVMESGACLYRAGRKDLAEQMNIGCQYDEIHEKVEHELGSVNFENVVGLYGKHLNLSASQIDKHAECRLAYFLRYGLRAQERKSFTVDPAEFGTYVHDVLEKTGREVKTLGGFRAVSLADTLQIANKYAQEYAKKNFSQLDSERITYLFKRNGYELELVVTELWEELQGSCFSPEGFEVAFGEDKDFDAIPLPGKKMSAQLGGYVDRVDVWESETERFFRVVDYKTGKKDFDYCDLINGLGLQMLLYLFALEDSGASLVGAGAVPSGVQYFPARAPVVSADGKLTDDEAKAEHLKEWKRKGLLLEEESVIVAMDDTEKLIRLCCTRKKDGSFSGDLASRQQFHLLKAYIFKLLGKMVDDIAAGDVSANPYTRGESFNACKYCPYGSVCHSDDVEGRRDFKKISAGDFWEKIDKEVQNNG